jgi:hypothetical protein
VLSCRKPAQMASSVLPAFLQEVYALGVGSHALCCDHGPQVCVCGVCVASFEDLCRYPVTTYPLREDEADGLGVSWATHAEASKWLLDGPRVCSRIKLRKDHQALKEAREAAQVEYQCIACG